MSRPSDRRGFLRGLATLPLIGGGVTLIGNPVGAAEPVTPQLLDAYEEWLDLERAFLRWERFGPEGFERQVYRGFDVVWRNRATGDTFDTRTVNRVTGYRDGRHGDSPASRAAVVLAAAGCDWRVQP